MTLSLAQWYPPVRLPACCAILTLGLQLLAGAATPNPDLRSPKAAPHPTPPSRPEPAASPDWGTAELGPHHRVWTAPPDLARAAANRTYVELGTGINRWDPAQQHWVPARAEFERTPDGYYVALHTQHQVILPPDLNVVAAVDLLTPDLVRLRSTILGIALVDGRSGRSVLLAEIQACVARQVSPTEIIYRDAFDGLLADIRYVVTIDRFEQDVILRERIDPDALAAAGLNPESTRLLVLTEFFNPPKPGKRTRELQLAHGEKMGDQEIRFGVMSVAAGQAFPTEDAAAALPVTKSWETIEGRQFLVEAVHYPSILPLLQSLPRSPQSRTDSLRNRLRRTVSNPVSGTLPPNRLWAAIAPAPRQASTPRHELVRPLSLRETARFARDLHPAGPTQRPAYLAEGVVIDYPLTLSTGTNDYTFRADTTYCVTSTFSIGGTTTLEGGTVIKLATGNNPAILCYGPVRCLTAPFLPAILTSIHDDTVGEILPGSCGNPALGYQGNPALQFLSSGAHLRHLRVAHANRAIFFHDYSAGANSLSHAQFVHCLQAITVNGYGTYFQNLALRNLLFHNIATVFTGYSFTASGQHLTCVECPTLAVDTLGRNYGTTSALSLVNSLLVATGDAGSVTVAQDHCASVTRYEQAFQSVGAGRFYLANPALRDAGTTAIDPVLAAELRTKTTWPPRVRSGPVNAELLSSPQALRDLDIPDLGYHYDPIDEALDGCLLPSGVAWRITAGTAVATYGTTGIQLEENSRLSAQGTPANPVRFFRYTLVQEQSLNWSGSSACPFAIIGPSHQVTNPASAPSAEFQFAAFLAPAGPVYHLYSDSGWNILGRVSLLHCTAQGGQVRLAGTPGCTFDLGNTLWSRTAVTLGSNPRIGLWNCLFRGGAVTFNLQPPSSPGFVRDCVFDNVSLADLTGQVSNSHNAYVGPSQTPLRNPASPTLTLASLTYADGPFGPFYTTGTNLVDRGSRSAAAAGLFHFTTSTNNTPEAAGTVDIGLHYPVSQPATNIGPPLPHDSDQDGLSDIVEDSNGNGVLNSGETDWRDSRDTGLRIQITHPVNPRNLP